MIGKKQNNDKRKTGSHFNELLFRANLTFTPSLKRLSMYTIEIAISFSNSIKNKPDNPNGFSGSDHNQINRFVRRDGEGYYHLRLRAASDFFLRFTLGFS